MGSLLPNLRLRTSFSEIFISQFCEKKVSILSISETRNCELKSSFRGKKTDMFSELQVYISQFLLYNSQLRVYISQFWEKKARIARYKLVILRKKVSIASLFHAIRTLFLIIATLYIRIMTF